MKAFQKYMENVSKILSYIPKILKSYLLAFKHIPMLLDYLKCEAYIPQREFL